MTSAACRCRHRSSTEDSAESHNMLGKLDASHPIAGLPDTTVGHFWSWAYSNFLENTVRPVFAEYMVGVLLGVHSSGRISWDAADLRLGAHLIEVKSSAYVQAWKQTSAPRIVFDIARKRAWDADTNITADAPTRSAHCYVFCLYPEKDKARANPLDVAAWRFWVLATRDIDVTFDEQKSVALSRLQAQCDSVAAGELRAAVLRALDPNTQEPR